MVRVCHRPGTRKVTRLQLTDLKSCRFDELVYLATSVGSSKSPDILVSIHAARAGGDACGQAAKETPGILTGCMGVADGHVTGRCTGRISLVSAMAGSVSAIGINAPTDDLDAQHPLCFLRVVCVHARTELASSRLDPAIGIRIGRDGCGHRLASEAIQTESSVSTRKAQALKWPEQTRRLLQMRAPIATRGCLPFPGVNSTHYGRC